MQVPNIQQQARLKERLRYLLCRGLLQFYCALAAVFAGNETAQARPAADLSGIPIHFRCEAELPPNHDLLGSYPGEDLRSLAGARTPAFGPKPKEAQEDKTEDAFAEAGGPGMWLEDRLCKTAWNLFASSGAHQAATDLVTPSRAVLRLTLERADLFSSRMVDQRMGPALIPVSVPHWALALHWNISFTLEYPGSQSQGLPLQLVRRGGAEQEDYEPLRLGALLAASIQASLGELPTILADDGRLQDLLLPRLDTAPKAPPNWPEDPRLSESFWLLLSPSPRVRHDTMAILLSGNALPLQTRIELAEWFLMNDSDLRLRRDALAWRWSIEGARETKTNEIEPSFSAVLRWLLQKAPSPRLREAIVQSLARRPELDTRGLLLVAAADRSDQVSEVALTALRSFPAATSTELANLEQELPPPQLAAWTLNLSGRVLPEPADAAAHILALCAASPGPAAEAWLQVWLDQAEAEPASLEQRIAQWRTLSIHPEGKVRLAVIQRLARERGQLEAIELLASRVHKEPEPQIRREAVFALRGEDGLTVREALLKAAQAEQSEVRQAAASVLSAVSGQEAETTLRSLADKDPDPKTRRVAKKALRKRSKLR